MHPFLHGAYDIGRPKLAFRHRIAQLFITVMWQNIPSRSFGSNQVLFGGIRQSARAMASKSSRQPASMSAYRKFVIDKRRLVE